MFDKSEIILQKSFALVLKNGFEIAKNDPILIKILEFSDAEKRLSFKNSENFCRNVAQKLYRLKVPNIEVLRRKYHRWTPKMVVEQGLVLCLDSITAKYFTYSTKKDEVVPMGLEHWQKILPDKKEKIENRAVIQTLLHDSEEKEGMLNDEDINCTTFAAFVWN